VKKSGLMRQRASVAAIGDSDEFERSRLSSQKAKQQTVFNYRHRHARQVRHPSLMPIAQVDRLNPGWQSAERGELLAALGHSE